MAWIVCNLVWDWWLVLVVHQDLQAVPRIRAAIDIISTVMRRDHDVLMSSRHAAADHLAISGSHEAQREIVRRRRLADWSVRRAAAS
jgi:hypothetical protein